MAEEVLIAELRAATDKFRQDMAKAAKISEKAGKEIAESLDKIGEAAKPLPKDFEKLNKGLEESEKAAKSFGAGITKAGTALNTAFKATVIGAVVAVGVAIAKTATEAFRASQSMDAVERQLTKLTGSSQAAARELSFVREETRRLGLSTVEGAKGFSQIAIAAQGTVAEGQGVREIFRAINEITAANNLTQEQYTTLLTQTTQAMNKQKAELDDLKAISEAGVPIFQQMIKAFDTTPEKLFKAISDGKIGVQEMLVTMRQLHEEYGSLAEEAANTIPAKFKRGFNDVITGFSGVIGGILDSPELNKLFSSATSFISIDKIFPSKEQVTQFVDDFIGGINRIVAVGLTLFELLKKGIQKAWDDTLGYIINKTKELGSVFTEGNALIKKAWVSIFGEAEKAGDQAKAKAEQDNANGESYLASVLGVSPGGVNKNLDALDEWLRKAGGLTERAREDETKNANEARKKALEEDKKLLDQALKQKKQSNEKINAESITATKKRLDEQQKLEERHAEVVQQITQGIYDRQAEDLKKVLELEEEYRKSGKIAGYDFETDREREIKALEEAQKTYDTMRENVQDTLANLISDSIKGDLVNVKDMLDNVLDLFANFAAEAASKFVIDKVFDQAVNFLAGPNYASGGSGKGPIGGLLGTQIPGSTGSIGTVGGALGAVGAGYAGGQIGGGIGGAVGGKTGSIVGGVLGGAAAGAAFGAVVGGGILSIPAAAIGAVAGAVVGGITSAIQAGVFTSKDKTTVGVQTSPAGRGVSQTRITPFGVIEAFDESFGDDIVNQALSFIAETDRAIASYLDGRQRLIVKEYLQAAVPEGNIVSAEKDNDALAKLVAQRYYQAITAIAGQDVAQNVIGSPFGATSGDIGLVQKRGNEALALLKQIEEFRVGPITDTAAAIKSINEQFQALIDQATSLGIPTNEIVAEQQRQLAEITTNFNQGITDSILAIKDPIAAEYAALEREQEERRKNAIDAEANLTDLAELEALEREELAKRLNASTDGAGGAVDLLTQRLDAFKNQALSGTSQQLLALQNQFTELRDDMMAAGLSVSELTAAYQQQATVIRHQAVEGVLSAIYGITDPFRASMLQMAQQVREFQKLVAEGIIPQSTLDQFVSAFTENARYQEALRLAQGGGGPGEQFQQLVDNFVDQGLDLTDAEREMKQLTDQFNNLRDALVFLGVDTSILEAHYERQKKAIQDRVAEEKKAANEQKKADRERLQGLKQNFLSALYGITDPYKEALRQITEQVKEFKELVDKGLISRGQLARYRRLALGSAAVDEAQRLIGGGPRTAIEGVADAFRAFVEQGSPLTQGAQRMRELTDQFRGLMAAAGELRLDTNELRVAYLKQARAIREESIKAIDEQLQAQRDQIESIGSYLKQLRVGEELPANLRFDEARKQFFQATYSGDIQSALSAAETYRGIARERFGGTEAFFSFRTEIENTLNALKEREQQRLDQERNRLIRQEERELQQVQLGRSSLDHLRLVRGDTSEMARGIKELIQIAKNEAANSALTQQYIRRAVDRMRA